MNTIPADRGMVAEFEGTGTLTWDDVRLRTQRPASLSGVIRKTPIAVPLVKPVRRTEAQTKSSVWIRLNGETHAENWMMVLLVIAGFLGIAYGFSCLTDLVQNWAAVNAGVQTLIQ